jgi:hypothetical protein
MTDAELDRMVRNLRQAFMDASDHYEGQRQTHAHDFNWIGAAREAAAQLATISQAYLLASRERDEREERKGHAIVKLPASRRLHNDL